MEQKHLLWPAIIVVLLIGAGAVYVALQFAPQQKTLTPTPPAPQTYDTTELDREGAAIDEDIFGVEAELQDYTSVDPAQDASGI